MTPERLLALVLAHSPGFAEPVGGGRPTWTVLELSWGCAGFDNEHLSAFLWRYARDHGAGQQVRKVLSQEALKLAERENWPETISGQRYLGDLIAVVLAEETMSELQRDRLLRMMKTEWGEAVWDRYLAPKHRAIGAILDRMCVDAHEHISRRIREFDD